MNRGTLQYVADTIAIEDLASDFPIEKEAGLFEDIGFSGIASTIVSKIKSTITRDKEDMTALDWVKVVGEMLTTGALFKLHPLLGIAFSIANFMGVDLIGIGKKILGDVYNTVEKGLPISFADVDKSGFIAIAMYNDGLIKNSIKIDVPFFPSKGSSKIERVFGNLFRIGAKGRIKTLLVAILIWTLKTALLGVGVMAGANLITSFIKGKKKEEEPKPEVPEAKEKAKESKTTLKSIFHEINNTLTPSGRGTEEHRNDQSMGGFIWKAPIYGSIRQTLSDWAIDVYEELTGYEDIIYKSPSFKAMLRKFEDNYEPGDNSVMVPKGFTSRKQVVDTFAQEVSKKIKEKNE